jgi:hypothetical protein
MLLFTVLTGGLVAGAFLIPPAIGAEIEFSSLERQIESTSKRLDALEWQVDLAADHEQESELSRS